MRNKMNMKNKTHKCVLRNSQINLPPKSLSNRQSAEMLIKQAFPSIAFIVSGCHSPRQGPAFS